MTVKKINAEYSLVFTNHRNMLVKIKNCLTLRRKERNVKTVHPTAILLTSSIFL